MVLARVASYFTGSGSDQQKTSHGRDGEITHTPPAQWQEEAVYPVDDIDMEERPPYLHVRRAGGRTGADTDI